MSASFDSMVLIYAGVAPSNHTAPSPDFKELRTRALILLDEIAGQQTTCILSAIVLSELLGHVQQSKKGQFAAEFSAQYVVAPFDLRAASISSDLWSAYLAQTAKSRSGLPKTDRVVMRADCMIVASVFAAGATDFFTHDKGCRTFAKLAGMNVHDLPDISTSMMGKWMAADIDAGIDLAAPTKPMKRPKDKVKKKKRKK